MKYLFLLLFTVAGFWGLNAQDDANGKKIVPVEDFQGKADAFVGKTIYVSGTVDHVCKHGGKKVVIVSDDGQASLKIMAGDKISKFDKSIEGETINVLGTVKELRVDEAYLVNWEEEVKDHHKPSDQEYKDDMAKIADFRKQIKESKKGYLSFYSMDGIEYEVVK
ncbi:MAG TPA: hypothetical protein ENI82_04070 [Bacteroidetes bacterium]|nr:hypothetical protein [Bacteroidota bacterium]